MMVLTAGGRRHEIVREGDRYYLDGEETTLAAINKLNISPNLKAKLAEPEPEHSDE